MRATSLDAIVAVGAAVDRALVAALAEDRWQAILSADDGPPKVAVREAFDRRIEEVAATMEAIHSAAFLQTVAEEEQRIVNAYIHNRVEVGNVTELVENHYRAFIPLVENKDKSAAAVIAGFIQRTDDAAKQMGPAQGAAYLQRIESEDARLGAEYMVDKAAFKQRLGIVSRGGTLPNHGYVDLAVRTAIRATIWESLAKLIFGR
jgi:hypothetical protein